MVPVRTHVSSSAALDPVSFTVPQLKEKTKLMVRGETVVEEVSECHRGQCEEMGKDDSHLVNMNRERAFGFSSLKESTNNNQWPSLEQWLLGSIPKASTRLSSPHPALGSLQGAPPESGISISLLKHPDPGGRVTSSGCASLSLSAQSPFPFPCFIMAGEASIKQRLLKYDCRLGRKEIYMCIHVHTCNECIHIIHRNMCTLLVGI